MKHLRYKKFFEASRFDNTIYYAFYYSLIGGKDTWVLHLTGDTFDIKDTIRNAGFHWDGAENAWVYNKTIYSEKEGQQIGKIVFPQIESLGYSVSLGQGMGSGSHSIVIKTHSVSKLPTIPHGNGSNIIIKEWHHYAPVNGITGKGTFLIKNLLQYYGFRYTGKMYQGLFGTDEEKNEFIKYVSAHGYNVIDEIE